MFRVVVRNWWKIENGQRVPNPRARKTTLAKVSTEKEAQRMCATWNHDHNPGRLSRRAEYTEE